MIRPPPGSTLFPYTTLFRSLPGIQAAFVDIGTEKSAFLHASDVVYPDDKAAAEDGEEDDATDTAAESEDRPSRRRYRSEEHTSELQSRFDLVCRLLLEKKKP